MTNTKKGIGILTIGALGVVFGDIGTSPLYAMKAIFGNSGFGLSINQLNIHGIISVIFWTITIVVSIKYIGFLMRANNEGEGGIIALIAIIKDRAAKYRFMPLYVMLGLVGMALFYGDSVITPAISVLSAVEGLEIVTPSLASFIIPVTLVILSLLFWIQRFGTDFIGHLFGPIMLIWFLCIGLAGLIHIIDAPVILNSLSPLSAYNFISAQPLIAFLSMGAVILVVTGAEALYADMGHFGRTPIARAWLLIVFPALTLCYMGQGALLLNNPQTINNPLLLLFPDVLRFSVVLLATLATLIASQSVISGAFSLTQQAVHLNFLPKMTIKHTSQKTSGQVYLPFINFCLFISVVLLVLIFGSSQNLANAYGMAVSMTLAIDTVLFAIVARLIWRKNLFYIVGIVLAFLILDLIFVASNLSKIITGGWFPLIIAASLLLIILTWLKGTKINRKEREQIEEPLPKYIENLKSMDPPITRIPGTAIYISHHSGLTPMAVRASVEQLHELHENVIILTIEVTNSPHVPKNNHVKFDDLGYNNDGICLVNMKFGYHDSINVPKNLMALKNISPELNFKPNEASYFVSLGRIVPTKKKNMPYWQKRLYTIMASNATSSTDYYKLPVDQTVEMRSLIKL